LPLADERARHERIAGFLDEVGYAPVADGAQPDVVALSTCAVCENADNKLDGNRGSQLLSRVLRRRLSDGVPYREQSATPGSAVPCVADDSSCSSHGSRR
jgi:hypothetical protein